MGNPHFLAIKSKPLLHIGVVMLLSASSLFAQGLPSNAQSPLTVAQKSKFKVPGVKLKGKFKASRVLTRGKTISTRTLMITGAGNKTNQVADFKPVQVKTKNLTITGMGNETTAVKAFTPVKITTQKFTITGTQSTPKIPVVNIGRQTNAFSTPLKQPVKVGSLTKSNIIKTRLLTITGKDNLNNQVASFTPVRITTQALTITGSGVDENAIAPFTPKQIRTKTLTITGESSGKH